MNARTDGRRRPRSIALLAPVTLAAGLLTAAAPAGTGGAEAASRSSAACGAAAAEARVMAGYAGRDPNSMTAQQSAAREGALQQRVDQRRVRARVTLERARTITVDVRVHVITRDDGTGGVTRKMVNDQIDVLNQAFAGATSGASTATPFRFRVKSYDVTANTDWYNWSPRDDEIPAKRALHKGGYEDLNIYVANLSGGLLGYAFYPQDQAGFQDGVVLLGDSLPGGSAAPYNQGDTATHEVGHWLGLAHTFDNGCQPPGDRVDDTPYQADGDNIFFCRESDNTCPQPGRDPVHNFMSYGDDPCLDRFTAGQRDRMVMSWLAYRET